MQFPTNALKASHTDSFNCFDIPWGVSCVFEQQITITLELKTIRLYDAGRSRGPTGGWGLDHKSGKRCHNEQCSRSRETSVFAASARSLTTSATASTCRSYDPKALRVSREFT